MQLVGAALRRTLNGPRGSQRTSRRHPRLLRFGGALAFMLVSCSMSFGSTVCPSERAKPLPPTDRTLCAELAQSVRNPRALPLDAYQAKLAQFLRNYCHRDEASGWKRDKHVRDTGPYIGTLKDGKWTGTYFGTHAPVVTWYSPDMHGWLKVNRAEEHAAANEPPVPDGAIMVKEMFPPPAAACATVDPLHLAPTSGAAVMVRDAELSAARLVAELDTTFESSERRHAMSEAMRAWSKPDAAADCARAILEIAKKKEAPARLTRAA